MAFVKMHCLWCGEEIVLDVNWQNIFWLKKSKSLCHMCDKRLEILSGSRCQRCSRESSDPLCLDCLWWEKQFNGHDPLLANFSVFRYNQTIQDMIAKWKYRGDYCLGKIFQPFFYEAFKKQFASIAKNMIAVPIPLSAERIEERGFNQAKMLAEFLPLPVKDILSRTDGEKQSKKTRNERLQAKNPFTLGNAINKPVLLVDDIYTTGSTLRHAATRLKASGCPKVHAFTLVRG